MTSTKRFKYKVSSIQGAVISNIQIVTSVLVLLQRAHQKGVFEAIVDNQSDYFDGDVTFTRTLTTINTITVGWSTWANMVLDTPFDLTANISTAEISEGAM